VAPLDRTLDESMTQNTETPHEYGEHGPHLTDRYAAITLADGSLLVYDVEATTGWVTSDATVSLAEMQ
jgi:hypothetical protein